MYVLSHHCSVAVDILYLPIKEDVKREYGGRQVQLLLRDGMKIYEEI